MLHLKHQREHYTVSRTLYSLQTTGKRCSFLLHVIKGMDHLYYCNFNNNEHYQRKTIRSKQQMCIIYLNIFLEVHFDT